MKLPPCGMFGALALLLTLMACQKPSDSQSGQATQTSQATQSGQAPQATRPSAPSQTTAPVSATDPVSGLRWMARSALPMQGQQTYALILRGGPFPYARDGVTFQNREGTLPGRSRGTYREYTVKTPGSSDRGAKRIVCAALPECYYTEDHYASFRRIRP